MAEGLGNPLTGRELKVAIGDVNYICAQIAYFDLKSFLKSFLVLKTIFPLLLSYTLTFS